MPVVTSLDFWLWAVTALLACLYLASGVMKAIRPIPALAQMMRWPGDYPLPFVRFIGIIDMLGGLGLVLPLATGILVWLSPVAAICLVLLQVLAIGFHLIRREAVILPVNVLLLVLAAFVAWGRLPLLGL